MLLTKIAATAFLVSATASQADVLLCTSEAATSVTSGRSFPEPDLVGIKFVVSFREGSMAMFGKELETIHFLCEEVQSGLTCARPHDVAVYDRRAKVLTRTVGDADMRISSVLRCEAR